MDLPDGDDPPNQCVCECNHCKELRAKQLRGHSTNECDGPHEQSAGSFNPALPKTSKGSFGD